MCKQNNLLGEINSVLMENVNIFALSYKKIYH